MSEINHDIKKGKLGFIFHPFSLLSQLNCIGFDFLIT